MAARHRPSERIWIADPSALAEVGCARCIAFNEAHPVGSAVLVWVGTSRDGCPVPTQVIEPALFHVGEAEPLVRVRGFGFLALSRVFEASEVERRELFLDGQRIEVEDAVIRVSALVADALRAAAAARGISATELANRLIEAASDGLIDAILEDGAQIRARRRYSEAA